MTPVPFDLPLRPDEAGELANVIFEHAEGKKLTDDLRNRLAARAATLRLESLRPWLGSLERDPVHRSTYFVAVDGHAGQPLLLHVALASSPANALYPKAVLIGRMRRPGGPEIVVNASPFGPGDHSNVLRFAEKVNQAFLPRPQGAQAAVAIVSARPADDIPPAFDAWRAILKRTGRNVAAITGDGKISPADLYHGALWSAIRAGWREGYALDPGLIVAGDPSGDVAAFTGYTIDASALVCDASAGDDGGLRAKFESGFDAGEREWLLQEFSKQFTVGDRTYEFAPDEVQRLALRFGPALKAVERTYDSIRQARTARRMSRGFDVEPWFGYSAPSCPSELLFCLQWLKARGRPAATIAPRLAWDSVEPCEEALGELAAAARHCQASLSIAPPANAPCEALDAVGRACGGRVYCRVAAGGPPAALDEIAQRFIG